jgi:hypothetical protein
MKPNVTSSSIINHHRHNSRIMNENKKSRQKQEQNWQAKTEKLTKGISINQSFNQSINLISPELSFLLFTCSTKSILSCSCLIRHTIHRSTGAHACRVSVVCEKYLLSFKQRIIQKNLSFFQTKKKSKQQPQNTKPNTQTKENKTKQNKTKQNTRPFPHIFLLLWIFFHSFNNSNDILLPYTTPLSL